MARFPLFQWLYGRRSSLEFSLVIEIEDVKKWNHWIGLDEEFTKHYEKLFIDCVLQAHKYLIRITPFDTGRLRGGWTSYLDNKRKDYSAAFLDTSLIGHGGANQDTGAIQEGKTLSTFQEKYLDVFLSNGVPYASYLETGTSKMAGRHFTSIAKFKAEYIFNSAIELWARECDAAGGIVEPSPLSEVTA